MDGTRKYHPDWGNPDQKEHGYILTDRWKLNKKYRISRIRPIDTKSFKKKGGGGRGQDQVWGEGRKKKSQRTRRINENIQFLAVEGWGWVLLESSRDLGYERLLGLNVSDLSQNMQQCGEGTPESTSSRYSGSQVKGTCYQPTVKISDPELFLSKRITRTKI